MSWVRNVAGVFMIAAAFAALSCTVSVSDSGGGRKANDTDEPTDVPESPGDDTPDAAGADELVAGRSNQSLEASGRRTFQLSALRGETVIVNTSLPDSRTDVDMFAFAPGGDRIPIASSESAAGRPDMLTFVADQTGDYIIEVVNISGSERADLSLDVQQIPARTTVSSSLNGVYEVTSRDGNSTQGSASVEAWVFSAGELASMFGVMAAEDLAQMGAEATEDVPYWIDAVNNTVSEIHIGEVSVAFQIRYAAVEEDGRSMSMTVQLYTTASLSGTTAEANQTLTFDGTIDNGGDTLSGTLSMVSEGDAPLEITYTTTLERRRSSASID